MGVFYKLRRLFSIANISSTTHIREMNYSAFESSKIELVLTTANHCFVAQGLVVKHFGLFFYGSRTFAKIEFTFFCKTNFFPQRWRKLRFS